MPSTAIVSGILLILVGIAGYAIGVVNDNASLTAMIPAACADASSARSAERSPLSGHPRGPGLPLPRAGRAVAHAQAV